jgi:hypothetical protein
MKELTIAPDENLNIFASQLKKAGFKIINSYTYKNLNPAFQKFFHFYKDGYIGFAEMTYKGVYTIGAEYKHSLEFGKGTQYYRGEVQDCLTIENAKESLKMAKDIVKNNLAENWKLEEFLDSDIRPKELL